MYAIDIDEIMKLCQTAREIIPALSHLTSVTEGFRKLANVPPHTLNYFLTTQHFWYSLSNKVLHALPQIDTALEDFLFVAPLALPRVLASPLPHTLNSLETRFRLTATRFSELCFLFERTLPPFPYQADELLAAFVSIHAAAANQHALLLAHAEILLLLDTIITDLAAIKRYELRLASS